MSSKRVAAGLSPADHHCEKPARPATKQSALHRARRWLRLRVALGCLMPIQLAAQQLPVVRIATTLGDIDVEVDTVRAPVTASNFLRYVDAGRYTGGVFHRTVTLEPDNQPNKQIKIEVIQAGLDSTRFRTFPAIALERTSVTGLHHGDGCLSMGRDGPDTATSDFFICIGAQPELDFGGRRNPDGQGFAAFGRVLRGMDVVRKIHRSPVKAQVLTPPIAIASIARLRS